MVVILPSVRAILTPLPESLAFYLGLQVATSFFGAGVRLPLVFDVFEGILQVARRLTVLVRLVLRSVSVFLFILYLQPCAA